MLVESSEAVPTEMVIHAFKKCGITNNLDGTEDDLIYEDLCATSCRQELLDEDTDCATDCYQSTVPVASAFCESEEDEE